MTVMETGFVVLFAASLAFTALTIFRQTKFSAVYATFGFVFWFVLAGVNLAVFAEAPAFIPLSYLWFAVGLVVEIVGITITLQCIRVDRENRDFQI